MKNLFLATALLFTSFSTFAQWVQETECQVEGMPEVSFISHYSSVKHNKSYFFRSSTNKDEIITKLKNLKLAAIKDCAYRAECFGESGSHIGWPSNTSIFKKIKKSVKVKTFMSGTVLDYYLIQGEFKLGVRSLKAESCVNRTLIYNNDIH